MRIVEILIRLNKYGKEVTFNKESNELIVKEKIKNNLNQYIVFHFDLEGLNRPSYNLKKLYFADSVHENSNKVHIPINNTYSLKGEFTTNNLNNFSTKVEYLTKIILSQHKLNIEFSYFKSILEYFKYELVKVSPLSYEILNQNIVLDLSNDSDRIYLQLNKDTHFQIIVDKLEFKSICKFIDFMKNYENDEKEKLTKVFKLFNSYNDTTINLTEFISFYEMYNASFSKDGTVIIPTKENNEVRFLISFRDNKTFNDLTTDDVLNKLLQFT